MRTPKGKPKGRAASTAAVAIDGADSKGKANDKEVCGDAAAVSQRRSEAPRRRAAAIQVYLDKKAPTKNAQPVFASAPGSVLRSTNQQLVFAIVSNYQQQPKQPNNSN